LSQKKYSKIHYTTGQGKKQVAKWIKRTEKYDSGLAYFVKGEIPDILEIPSVQPPDFVVLYSKESKRSVTV